MKYTANADKLLSIIYYNYPPGKQNIGSSYLDTIKSIYNILYTLKTNGYNVGELPKSVNELEDLMLKCGINVATWAPGELEKLANQKSMRIEFKTCDKIKIGLPVKNDNEPATCKLYFLKKDSVIYMREEWNDEYNSVAIYDKDSLRLWQNGKLQKTLEIPFHPARYEFLFD